MKKSYFKNLLKTIAFLLIANVTYGQITFFGNTYAPGNYSFDAGTSSYSWDSWSGPGGFRIVFRLNGYWYITTTGIGLTNSSNTYALYRTVNSSCTTAPPNNASWYQYPANPYAPGGFWPSFSSGAAPIPSGGATILTIPISGNVTVVQSSTTQILPDFIDLANKTEAEINAIPNSPGRILFNNCNANFLYNTGTDWKAIWPNNSDYPLNVNQAFTFGDNTAKLYGKQSFSGAKTIVLESNSQSHLEIGQDNSFQNNSGVNFKSSVGSSVKYVSSNYTLTNQDHVITLQQIVPTPTTFTLPPASSATGRQYVIINSTSGNLNISPAVNGLVSNMINSLRAASFISDGNTWYLLN